MSAGDLIVPDENSPTFESNRSHEGQHHGMTTEPPKHLLTFFRGEPEALGATQIFGGIFLFAFGLTLTLSNYYRRSMAVLHYTGMTYWSGILYVVSGSLSVAASAKPALGKVKASLVLNIISSVAAGVSLILILISFIEQHYYRTASYCAHYIPEIKLNENGTCEANFDVHVMEQGLLTIISLFIVLMFCITISTSVFGCRTACRSSYSEVNIILYQTNVVNAPVTTTEAGSVTITPLPST